MTGQDRTGRDRAGQGRTWQDRTGQGTAGQDRTGQGRAGQGRTVQDRTGQDRTGQDRTGQDKAGQSIHPSPAPPSTRTRTYIMDMTIKLIKKIGFGKPHIGECAAKRCHNVFVTVHLRKVTLCCPKP